MIDSKISCRVSLCLGLFLIDLKIRAEKLKGGRFPVVLHCVLEIKTKIAMKLSVLIVVVHKS